MKNLIRIIFWAMVAFVGSRVFGGGLGWWILAVTFGRALFQFVFTVTLALVLYVAFYALIIIGYSTSQDGTSLEKLGVNSIREKRKR